MFRLSTNVTATMVILARVSATFGKYSCRLTDSLAIFELLADSDPLQLYDEILLTRLSELQFFAMDWTVPMFTIKNNNFKTITIFKSDMISVRRLAYF